MAGPIRYYTAGSTAAAVSPAFDAEWENTASALRRAISVTEFNESIATSTALDGLSTADRDVLNLQFVSDAIAAGPITGTLKGQIQAMESSPNPDMRIQMIVRVVSNDGSTFRGTLYGPDTAALSSEFNTARRNVQAPRGGAVALSAVTAQANDRIVIEIGYRKHGGYSGTGTLYYGGLAAYTALPEDETTTTTTTKPWFEFSADLYTARGSKARAYILE